MVAGNRGFVQRDECVEASRDKAEIEDRGHWQWSDDGKLELIWQRKEAIAKCKPEEKPSAILLVSRAKGNAPLLDSHSLLLLVGKEWTRIDAMFGSQF